MCRNVSRERAGSRALWGVHGVETPFAFVCAQPRCRNFCSLSAAPLSQGKAAPVCDLPSRAAHLSSSHAAMADTSVATLAFTEVADLLNQVDLSAQQPALIGTNAPVGCTPIRPTERAPQPAGRAGETFLATMLFRQLCFLLNMGARCLRRRSGGRSERRRLRRPPGLRGLRLTVCRRDTRVS